MNPAIFIFALYLVIGIIAVSAVDIIGSIVSREARINYGYFSILSFIVYTYLAYMMMLRTESYTLTAICLLLAGYYDATIGWKICLRFGAYMGKNTEEIVAKTTPAYRFFAGIMMAILCGGIGIFLAMR